MILQKLSLMMAVALMAGSAQGASESWGGNRVKGAYIKEGQRVLDYLRNEQNGKTLVSRYSLNLNTLAKGLEPNRIVVSQRRLTDRHGSLVDALTTDTQVELYEPSWLRYLAEKISITQHVFHELLRQQRLDDDYGISNQLPLTSGPASDDQILPVTILEEVGMDAHRTGALVRESLKQDCQRVKQTYEDAYFMVICEYHEKTWEETHETGGVAYSTFVAGYASESARREASASAIYATRRYEAGASASAVYEYSTSTPVMGETAVPYAYSYTVEKALWGLRVIGLGDLRQMPWKKLYSSLDEEAGLPPLTYPTERKALVACNKHLLLAQSQTNTRYRYHKARCRSERGAQNQFGFVVQSRNPFVGPRN